MTRLSNSHAYGCKNWHSSPKQSIGSEIRLYTVLRVTDYALFPKYQSDMRIVAGGVVLEMSGARYPQTGVHSVLVGAM